MVFLSVAIVQPMMPLPSPRMSNLTTPLPPTVRKILQSTYDDFDGHIANLYCADWLTEVEHRWVERMREDLGPLWELLEEDRKLRDSQ